jgi:hypothetical protein
MCPATETVAPWINVLATKVHDSVDPTVKSLNALAKNEAVPEPQRQELERMARNLEQTAQDLCVTIGFVMTRLPDMNCGFCEIMK